MISLALLLAFSCKSDPEPKDTPPKAAKAKAKAKAEIPLIAVSDDNLLDGAPNPVERLELSEAVWGVGVPNAVKGLPLIYDAKKDQIWHSAITSGWVVATDLEKGHPVQAVDLELTERWNVANLLFDAKNRHIIWVSAKGEQLRVVDIDKGELIAKTDPDSGVAQGYPTQACAIDGDGWTWVCDQDKGRVTGFDPTCSSSVEVPIGKARNVAASPNGRFVGVLSGGAQGGKAQLYSPETREITEFANFGPVGMAERLPRKFVVLDDGGMVFVGDEVIRASPEGKALWRTTVDHMPKRMAIVGDSIVLTLADAGFDKGRPGGETWILDLETGELRAQLETGYESLGIAGDAAGGRIFVAQGGDGTIAVVDTKTNKVSKELHVALSAEDIVVDPDGDRFVLSRLGGSRIYRWDRKGSVSELGELPWPFELAIDGAGDRLVAATHYDSAIYTYDLKKKKSQPTKIDLGIDFSTGDALGDMDFDEASGLAAVVHPESGWVVVADTKTNEVVWKKQYAEFAIPSSAGPGKGLVAIGKDRVYAVLGGEVVLALSLKNGEELARQELRSGARSKQDRAGSEGKEGKAGKAPAKDGKVPKGQKADSPEGPRKKSKAVEKEGKSGKAPKGGKAGKAAGVEAAGKGSKSKDARTAKEAAASDAKDKQPNTKEGKAANKGSTSKGKGNPGLNTGLDSLVYDDVGHRVFLGGLILDADTLAPSGEAPFSKAIHTGRQIIAVQFDEDRREYVVVCDAKTLSVIDKQPLVQSGIIPGSYAYDPATKQLYAAQLDKALVNVWALDW